MNQRSPSMKCRGFTLLEVLVALIVLSIGLLGLSGLQNVTLRSNHGALLRSEAILLSMDILDRIRANRDVAVTGSYDIDFGDSVSSPGCSSGCSKAEVAQHDLFEWLSYVGRLPDGSGDVSVDSDGIATVRLQWVDARDSTLMLEMKTVI